MPALASAAFAVVAIGWLSAPARALDAERSVTAGRESFGSASNFPWYDEINDDVRPIALPAPVKPWRIPRIPLQAFAWAGLVLLLGALMIVLVRMVIARRSGAPRSRRRDADAAPDPARIEALPFLVDRSQGDLLAEARRHYQQGNYGEAIIYLFSYELVQLDKFALIQLAKGKTNRQYLRETGRTQPLGKLLESTMVAFESVFFGRRPLDRLGFEACWNRLDEFESLLVRAAT